MSGKVEKIDDFTYSKENLLGHGAFAVVYKGWYEKVNNEVAIKAIAKKNLNKTKNLLTKEIKILRDLSSLKHENLVSLLKCVETTTHVYLVMEYCNGGELNDYLHSKHTLNENTIQHFFSQIAKAIKALHAKGIVHRDLKPANILLCKPSNKSSCPVNEIVVKLADFGFARVLDDGAMAATLCGSPMYMAPEVIMSQPYDGKADLWSIGTIMFQCLTGNAPFIEKTPTLLKTFYEKHRDLRPKIPDTCSAPLRDLLLRLLKRNPKDRIEFDDFFEHPFFTKSLPIPAARKTESHVISSTIPRNGSSQMTPTSNTFNARTLQNRITTEPMRPSRPTTLQRHGSNADQKGVRTYSGVGVQSPNSNPQPVLSNVRNMSDSQEFTFLPPLNSNRQQHIQYSNGTAQTNENPVKQVQVHSSNVLNSRGVPVPSQRNNFMIMEERRNSSKSPSMPPQHPNQGQIIIPSIENITVPETKFIIHEQPQKMTTLSHTTRRYTTNDLTTCAKDEIKEEMKKYPVIHEQPGPSIPKSVTSFTPLNENIKVETKLNPPPVDNIQYLSASPSRTSATATVKLASPSTPQKTTLFPAFSSDEEEEEGENDTQNYRGNGANMESSSSQMMESVSGNETGTTTSSGVYSGAAARVKSQNDSNNKKTSTENINPRPLFEVEPPMELDPEIMLEGEHQKSLAQLEFVHDFVKSLVDFAENIANPIAMIVEGGKRNNDNSDVYKRNEQLVLYVRALYYLTAALNFSEQQIKSGNLHPSPKVKHLLNYFNEKYHHCLTKSQELASLGIAGGTSIVSAENIMYKHALDLCQSAALDELFGKPQLCPKRYQTAYMMLHTLSEQVQNEQDRSILARYKSAVEKRLRILESKGLVTAIANN
uniref:Non-specific serine/threonine protein kinase n=1 Tax=Panagrolaimus sp. JU765 TaxID=591449 RepID=A0AC34R2W2_9BILA